jgi:flagella basal body P-ring formation protein FlgA
MDILKNKRSSVLAAMYLYMLWFGGSAVFGQTKIILNEQAVVPGPVVTVADIATISGGISDFIERIGSVSVSTAPMPVMPIQLTDKLIEYKLKENQIKMTDITVGGAKRVLVYLDTVMIAGERIIEVARKYLENIEGDKEIKRSIEFVRVPPPRPAARRELSIKARPLTIGRLRGSFSLYVGIYNGELLTQSVPVQVKIRTFGPLVVAVRAIPRGTIITEEHVEIITYETTNYNYDLVKDKRLLIGKEARIPIKSGKPIKINDVVKPVLIHRGEAITIAVEKGGIVITCTVVAQKNGRQGDTIPVKRNNQRNFLQVTIVSESEFVVQ